MGLTQARSRFFAIRKKCQVLVKNHAFKDYPQRGFSIVELVYLVRTGMGRFTDNNSDVAIKDSYLFYPKDDENRECKLVLKIEELEIHGQEGSKKETVIVCSAYREIKYDA